jgi:hypothetical protein
MFSADKHIYESYETQSMYVCIRCAEFTGSQKHLVTDISLGLLTAGPRVRFRLISCEIRDKMRGCAAWVFQSPFFGFLWYPVLHYYYLTCNITVPRNTASASTCTYV